MNLFSKKCWYCRNKIEKTKEIIKDVRVIGYIGTSPKNFCSNEHANKYEDEIKKRINEKKQGKSCCG